MSRRTTFLTFTYLAMSITTVFAESNIEQITIFNDAQSLDRIPGSATLISESLDDFAVTDIMRILASAPGVYYMEEDGYGLRPNIGMRGNSSDRSEKVTVMEDGILAAPAPYASPAAYYFPTIGRMTSVEILKGSSSVKYGPRTSGGVINLTSVPIPNQSLTRKMEISSGSDGFRKLHALIGGRSENIGMVAEVFHYGADGFKTLNSGQGAGFEKTDLLSKMGLFLGADKDQYLEFKFKYSDEDSDETYLGLTQADFNRLPYSRYSASQLDNMQAEHKQATANYLASLSENSELSIWIYRNEFARNWYKTQKIGGFNFGQGAEIAASVFDQNVNNDAPQSSLDVVLRANNRSYLSQGIQAQLDYLLGEHQLLFGIRIHYDEMDRYQWEDSYLLSQNMTMQLIDAGVPGSNSNRLDSADAFSVFIQDEVSFGALTITGGLRYEDILLQRQDWEDDLARLGNPARKANTVAALLPALGLTYTISPEITALAGVQRAFSPPSPGNNQAREEEGWNYEAGIRSHLFGWNSEIIGFYTSLDNLHGNCTNSQGCVDDTNVDQYNAGKVAIKGIEFSFNTQISFKYFNLPIKFNYTYSNAKFEESFNSSLDFWGEVSAGQKLPYLPENVIRFETGFENEHWKLLGSWTFIDEMRSVSGGELNRNTVPSRSIVDLTASYLLNDRQKLSLTAENLLDNVYIATERHGSIQPGKPLTIQIAYEIEF